MRVLLAIALIAGLLGGGRALVAPGSEAGPLYLTAPVERGTVSLSITAAGTARAVTTVAVGSQLSGQIDALHVDFNDVVAKGQALARIDQSLYRARRDEASAALAAARSEVRVQQARLDEARSRLATEAARRKVFAAQADRARIALAAAGAELARTERLRGSGGVAERQLDQARTERGIAAAGLREALAQAEVHARDIATREAELRRGEAELSNARAGEAQTASALAQAEVDLARTVIRAPIAGIVIDRSIDSGQTVAASLEAPTLFEIARDLREMEIHARIDEADIGRVRPGQRAVFRVDAHPDRDFEGRVRQIRAAPQVADGVVTYTVVLEAPNPDLALMPGMTAIVRLEVGAARDVLTVPNAALRFRPEGIEAGPGAIWVLDGEGRPRPVAARLGLSDHVATEVAGGGLAEGQRVVVGTAPQPEGRRLAGLRLGF